MKNGYSLRLFLSLQKILFLNTLHSEETNGNRCGKFISAVQDCR